MASRVSSSPRPPRRNNAPSRADGFEDTVLVPVTREDGSVFLPETVLGINAATQKKEQAEGFIRLFLGKENQRSLMVRSYIQSSPSYCSCASIDC